MPKRANKQKEAKRNCGIWLFVTWLLAVPLALGEENLRKCKAFSAKLEKNKSGQFFGENRISAHYMQKKFAFSQKGFRILRKSKKCRLKIYLCRFIHLMIWRNRAQFLREAAKQQQITPFIIVAIISILNAAIEEEPE